MSPKIRTPAEALQEAFSITLPEYNYALEWDIVDNTLPEDLCPTHQRREFMTREEFDSYHDTIRESARERLCENVQVFVRRVQVFPWVEGLVAP